MAAQKGSAMLMKVGNGASPEVFSTIAGLRSTSLTVNNGYPGYIVVPFHRINYHKCHGHRYHLDGTSYALLDQFSSQSYF